MRARGRCTVTTAASADAPGSATRGFVGRVAVPLERVSRANWARAIAESLKRTLAERAVPADAVLLADPRLVRVASAYLNGRLYEPPPGAKTLL